MIDREHELPIARQAKVLNISRGSVYYRPKAVSAADLALIGRLTSCILSFRSRGLGCCAIF
jgi:putative transposase